MSEHRDLLQLGLEKIPRATAPWMMRKSARDWVPSAHVDRMQMFKRQQQQLLSLFSSSSYQHHGLVDEIIEKCTQQGGGLKDPASAFYTFFDFSNLIDSGDSIFFSPSDPAGSIVVDNPTVCFP